MRKNPTRSEARLWKFLSKQMLSWGVTFIPQGVLLARYIGDFVCYELGLVIEVDGSIHKLDHIRRKDEFRTNDLMNHGYTVIRFTNTVVNQYPKLVCNSIKKEVNRIKSSIIE